VKTFMVERYLPGMHYGDLREAIERAAEEAKTMTAEGTPVCYLGSTIVPDEEACFCRFEGPDAEAVVRANERAGVPFSRIVQALLLER
jgi:hypothetical protein